MTTEAAIRDVMEDMVYGLYIIGSCRGDDVDGMMADWVTQVSFHPRLVAVAVENDARTLENIRGSRAFSVNFLPQDAHGMAIAAKFAQPYLDGKIKGRQRTDVRVHHKLEDVAFTRAPSGAPLLDGAMAWLECEAEQFRPTGDHTLVIGRVIDARSVRAGEPLTSSYTGWNYSG